MICSIGGSIIVDSSEKQLDNYMIIEELGKGTYGRVLKAKDLDTDEIVAIKLLHGEIGSKRKKDLKHEAWVQKKLNHKNIVRCLDYKHESKTGSYLVMEYVEGESLQKLLDKNPMEPLALDLALNIIKSCLSALGYAHTHESGAIIHGDIKPGNIIVPFSKEKEVKIADWGVAKQLGTFKMLNKGSSTCAAPEVLQCWKQNKKDWVFNQQSDLFSIGIIAYYILTGRHPFVDLSIYGRTISFLINDKYFKPPPMTRFDGEQIPDYLEPIISKLLEKHPRNRYQTAYITLNGLDSFGPRQPADIKVNIKFPLEVENLVLETSRCTYELKEGIRIIKKGGISVVQTGPSGQWQMILPSEARSASENQTVTAHLFDKNGKKWMVGPFYPFVMNEEARED